MNHILQKRKSEAISLGIVDYDETCSGYLCEDGSYRDFLRICTKDLVNATSSDVDLDILRWQRFYKTYDDDFKILTLNFPSYTERQQQHFRRQMEHTKNPRKQYWLQLKINELQWIETHKTTRDFYIMLFAPSAEALVKNRTDVLGKLGQQYHLVETLNLDTKNLILYKLANKSMLIHNEVKHEKERNK